MGLFILSRRI